MVFNILVLSNVFMFWHECMMIIFNLILLFFFPVKHMALKKCFFLVLKVFWDTPRRNFQTDTQWQSGSHLNSLFECIFSPLSLLGTMNYWIVMPRFAVGIFTILLFGRSIIKKDCLCLASTIDWTQRLLHQKEFSLIATEHNLFSRAFNVGQAELFFLFF